MEQANYPDKLYVEKDYQHKNFFYGYPYGDRSSVEYTRTDLVPKWHKYPDEKPTVDESVLFCDDFEVSYGWYDEHGNWRDCDNYCVHGVKAWMELPKLYKET